MKLVLDQPAAKKPTLKRRVFRALRKPILVLLLLAGCVWGGMKLWENVREQVAIGPEYQLDPNQIEITPPPAWIHSDIRAQVIRDAGWGPSLSLLDERLTVKIAQAFQLHPWVAKVTRVSKTRTAGVQVELEYRRPVAMVEVDGGVLAIDGEATVLPSEDFSADEARLYPRIAKIQTGPRGPTGTRWGDTGVAAGAQLALFLRESWPTLQLRRIIPHVGSSTDTPDRITFSIVTKGDRELTWGKLPGKEAPGELPAAEKLARLKRHIETTGSLEQGDPLPSNPLSPVQNRTATLPLNKES